MKTPLGNDGSYIEADSSPRDTRFHRRIMNVNPMPNTRCGNYIALECGHQVMAFGNLQNCQGVLFCVQCRDHFDAIARN